MGHPESYFGQADVREAILSSPSPDEFYKKIHWLDSYKGGWMDKAFWTIKAHPEFRWDNGHSYVECPNSSKLSDFISDVKIHKGSRGGYTDGEGRYFLATRHCEPFRKDGPFVKQKGQTFWTGAWGKPTETTWGLWRSRMCSSNEGDFALGSLELIKWPEKVGYPQKYLLLAHPKCHIGSLWLALLTDLDVPIDDPYVENMPNNQA